MHDAGLDLGLGKDAGDGLGKALEAVHRRDEDACHPPVVLKLGHDPKPEFGSLGLLDPQAQDLLDPIHIHASARQTAFFLTIPSSRILTRRASKITRG